MRMIHSVVRYHILPTEVLPHIQFKDKTTHNSCKQDLWGHVQKHWIWASLQAQKRMCVIQIMRTLLITDNVLIVLHVFVCWYITWIGDMPAHKHTHIFTHNLMRGRFQKKRHDKFDLRGKKSGLLGQFKMTSKQGWDILHGGGGSGVTTLCVALRT